MTPAPPANFMTIHGIVFDIGGVLELTPELGVTAEWERRLQLKPGELDRRLEPVWEAGSLGKISEDVLIYSHEVGLVKPDRRIYEMTCEQLQLKPEEIIFVDDVDVNIEAAREFGMSGILFKYNIQTIGEIEAYIQDYEENVYF